MSKASLQHTNRPCNTKMPKQMPHVPRAAGIPPGIPLSPGVEAGQACLGLLSLMDPVTGSSRYWNTIRGIDVLENGATRWRKRHHGMGDQGRQGCIRMGGT